MAWLRCLINQRGKNFVCAGSRGWLMNKWIASGVFSLVRLREMTCVVEAFFVTGGRTATL